MGIPRSHREKPVGDGCKSVWDPSGPHGARLAVPLLSACSLCLHVPPGPTPGPAAQAVGGWELFRRTISGNCCCFLGHQQLPGPRLQTHVTWSLLCPLKTRKQRPREAQGLVSAGPGPAHTQRPRSGGFLPLGSKSIRPRRNQHQGEVRQGGDWGLATCC